MTNQNNEKSKNGKRLALILIALLLIVAVAFGAYTYSRYVSRQQGTGSATVATWGYSVEIKNTNTTATPTDNDFFYQYYDSADGSTVTGVADDGGNTIIAGTNAEGYVAPGVSGSLTFSVTGKAEVSAVVDVVLDNVQDVALVVTPTSSGTTFYYLPVVFTLTDNSTTKLINSPVIGSLAKVSAALETAFGTGKVIPATNTADINYSFELKWAWAFTNSSATLYSDTTLTTAYSGITLSQDDIDLLDTAIGQLTADTDGSIPVTISSTNYGCKLLNQHNSIEFELAVSATQVQDNSTN